MVCMKTNVRVNHHSISITALGADGGKVKLTLPGAGVQVTRKQSAAARHPNLVRDIANAVDEVLRDSRGTGETYGEIAKRIRTALSSVKSVNDVPAALYAC
jgi:hypothetical protein